MRFIVVAATVVAGLALAGCEQEALTAGEALQAIEELSLESQAQTVSSGTIELTTSFTIGQAVEAAAEELALFIETQLPCAEITLADATLTIEYGANPGDCTYHGQTYTGIHSIEIVSAAEGDVVVHHEWTELANGKVSVTGTADVTWSSSEGTRNVVHSLDWTRLSDGFAVNGSGDRTQAALGGDIAVGMTIEGTRQWTSERGDWDLDIGGVELRWEDPVPQAGSYELTTPFEGKRTKAKKTATVSFARVDEDTIRVTLESGDKSFDFDVSKSGEITEE
jgi:hypothetical protein